MAKKRAEKKTLEVGKDLTGDAILGDGNTIHKTITQNIFVSANPSSGIEDKEAPDEKRLSAKRITADPDYKYSIKQNIESIIYNSAILCEHIDPQIATRKTQATLSGISDRLLHINTQDPFSNAELAKQRIAEFNKVTGWEFTENNINLIDFFLISPEQIQVWLVFEEMYKDSSEKEWEIYKSCIEGLKFNNTGEDVYKQINDWMQNKAERIYEVVKKNFPDVSPKMYFMKPLEF
jgi:hypothetical protein